MWNLSFLENITYFLEFIFAITLFVVSLKNKDSTFEITTNHNVIIDQRVNVNQNINIKNSSDSDYTSYSSDSTLIISLVVIVVSIVASLVLFKFFLSFSYLIAITLLTLLFFCYPILFSLEEKRKIITDYGKNLSLSIYFLLISLSICFFPKAHLSESLLLYIENFSIFQTGQLSLNLEIINIIKDINYFVPILYFPILKVSALVTIIYCMLTLFIPIIKFPFSLLSYNSKPKLRISWIPILLMIILTFLSCLPFESIIFFINNSEW